MEKYFNPFMYAVGAASLGWIFLVAASKWPPLSSKGRLGVFAISVLSFLIVVGLLARALAFRIVVESDTNWHVTISWESAHEESWNSKSKTLIFQTGNKAYEIKGARSVSVLVSENALSQGYIRVKIYRNNELVEQQEVPPKGYLSYVWIKVMLPFPFGGDVRGSSWVSKHPPDTTDFQEIS